MTEASESLRANGKTFWLASLFLPKQVASEATTLYAFCRMVDDLADQQNIINAKEQLQSVRDNLHARISDEPVVTNLIRLAERSGMDLRAAECLLDVLIQDASAPIQILSETELLHYCYGAAGTVGLMMSAILRATGSSAKVQAIDLGIAMQLTNIARDVQEDAQMGRRYLPASWAGGLGPAEINNASPGSQEAKQISLAIAQILALADVFYVSGAKGFPSIPASARIGIRIAAAIYRHIGVKLQMRDCDFTQGRVVVSMPTKLRTAAAVMAGLSKLESMRCSRSVVDLHLTLSGLPGFA